MARRCVNTPGHGRLTGGADVTENICSSEGCDRPARYTGYCSMHSQRLARLGSPELPPRPSPSERFWAKVDRCGPDECWPFLGYVKTNGYGVFDTWIPDHQRHYAHRFAYNDRVGPIPDGLDVDHQCHNLDASCPGGWSCPHRRCCNPAHLRVCTRATNLRAGRKPGGPRPRPTHCIADHEFTAENTRWLRHGYRQCKACAARRAREFQARRRSQ